MTLGIARAGCFAMIAALAVASCRSGPQNENEAAGQPSPAPVAGAAATAGAAQPPIQETLYSIGGGPRVSVSSVTEIQFDNPFEGLTFSSVRRTGQDTWETDTGFRAHETTKTADGFILADSDVQIAVDLALAEVTVTVGQDRSYGPYDIVLAR